MTSFGRTSTGDWCRPLAAEAICDHLAGPKHHQFTHSSEPDYNTYLPDLRLDQHNQILTTVPNDIVDSVSTLQLQNL